MLLKEIKPGSSIDILIHREGYDYRLVSKIEEVKESKIFISLIAARNRVFIFKPSDKVEFIYKQDDRMFIWKHVKGSVSTLDGEKVHCLTAPLIGESYNRRSSYRVYVGREMNFTSFIPKEGVEKMERLPEDVPIELDPRFDTKKFSGFVKNISESGIGLFSNEILNEGSEFSFTYMTKYGGMPCVAMVRRITEEKEGVYQRFYGCVLEKKDKRLGKYLFEVQREKLKRQRG